METFSMLIEFEVASDKMEFARQVIHKFVQQVKNEEPDTLIYASFNDRDNPFKFTHIMVFRDEKVQEHHQNTAHVKEFTDKLYPACSLQPVFKPVKLVDGNF